MPAKEPVIPDYITVHLGPPDSDVRNVTVPFINYIKNISSAIYPTLPKSAITANIYARISHTLSRIFNQNYRARGYDFDITTMPPDDESFEEGNKIYRNISQIVDNIFNDYIVKGTLNQPYSTPYCSPNDEQCKGLTVWESVDLAERGYTPLQILQYFYGSDIGIFRNAPISSTEPYPGIPLRLGSFGNDVYKVQNYLNRISDNYPAIPKIPVGGIYDEATSQAVRKFQDISNLRPDGIVDKATWYLIQYAYNVAKRFDELFMEGYRFTGVQGPFKEEYKLGDSDDFVNVLRFYLSFISHFDYNIPQETVGKIFTPRTREAVLAFQQEYGLPVTGTVNRDTWNKIQQVYISILNSIPEPLTTEQAQFYPGYFITTGASPDIVRQLQTYLRVIALNDKFIPLVAVSGIYDPQTKAAVTAFQKQTGVTQTGYVGPLTWTEIVNRYNEYTTNKKREAEFQAKLNG